MGGTRFNGLALVQELVKWGHEVTVLNRGQSEARLPRGECGQLAGNVRAHWLIGDLGDPAQGIRPGPGHGRHLRGQGRPVGGP